MKNTQLEHASGTGTFQPVRRRGSEVVFDVHVAGTNMFDQQPDLPRRLATIGIDGVDTQHLAHLAGQQFHQATGL